jgi:hypothetical protein
MLAGEKMINRWCFAIAVWDAVYFIANVQWIPALFFTACAVYLWHDLKNEERERK